MSAGTALLADHLAHRERMAVEDGAWSDAARAMPEVFDDWYGLYALKLQASIVVAVNANHARRTMREEAERAAETRRDAAQSGTYDHDRAWKAARHALLTIDTSGTSMARGRR